MNTTSANPAPTRLQPMEAAVSNCPSAFTAGQCFTDISDQAPTVPHEDVFVFLKRIRHPWGPDEVERFGMRVGKMANSAHLDWTPYSHPRLGKIRVFPVPFLEWVYSTMASQFGWPTAKALEAPSSEALQRAREMLREHKKTAQRLREVISTLDDVSTLQAMRESVTWLDDEVARLREIVEAAEAPVEPA